MPDDTVSADITVEQPVPLQPDAPEDQQPEPDLAGAPAGRPLKFKKVDELQDKIDSYFDWCDQHVEDRLVIKLRGTGEQYHTIEKVISQQKPYTIHGLARALDTTRETLRDYESGIYDDRDMQSELRQSFSDTITRAKARIAEFAETQLYVAGASHGAQFNLKNNYGWKDESEVVNKNIRASEELDELDDQVAARENIATQASKELEALKSQGADTQPAAEEPPNEEPGPAPPQ